VKVLTFHRIAVSRNFELDDIMREGRCCDLGNFLRTSVRQSVILADTHKGQVWVGADVPSLRGEKDDTLFGSCSSGKDVGYCPGGQFLTIRRCCAVAPVDTLAVEIANILVMNGRWCELRQWRFEGVADL